MSGCIHKPAIYRMNPVLVSDLDETIISRKKGQNGSINLTINPAMLDIFHRAMNLREKGKIDAIMLLTNNSNMVISAGVRFLDLFNNKLVETYNGLYSPKINNMSDVFDIVYTGQPGVRKGLLNRTYNLVENLPTEWNPTPIYESGPSLTGLRFREAKNIDTVGRMLRNIGKSTASLEKRVYFFDDEKIDHVIKKEIEGKGGAYITISPPFGKGEDKTDFSPIVKLLDDLENPKLTAYKAPGLARQNAYSGRGRSRKSRRRKTLRS